MTGIVGALGAGYSASKILQYISQHNPAMAQKISAALNAGHTVDHILRYLQKHQKMMGNLVPERQQETPGKSANLYKTAQTQIHPSLKGMAQAGLGAAGAIGASYALSRALPKVLQGVQGTLPGLTPNAPTPGAPPAAPSPMGQPIPAVGQAVPGRQPQPIQQSPQPPVSPNITQQPPAIQPQINPTTTQQIFSKYPGFVNKIEEMLSAKNTPEAIATYFKKFNPSQIAKLEKEVGKPAEEIVKEYIASKPQTENVNPLDMGKSAEKVEISPEMDKVEEKTPVSITKGSVAISPQGVGEVKEIRNGKAIIDIDGKKHQVDEEELEQEPEDVVQTVQELLKIPEVDKSSIVSLFTYDPDESKMYIQFHNGETYKYLDVDPEKVFKVANKMGIPVTEGKNIFGAWSPDDKKSLGAALIKEIISDPKYKKSRKGEKENPNYVKLETLYDYWEKLRKKPKRR